MIGLKGCLQGMRTKCPQSDGQGPKCRSGEDKEFLRHWCMIYGYLGPNMALPTRTIVLPSSTAIL